MKLQRNINIKLIILSIIGFIVEVLLVYLLIPLDIYHTPEFIVQHIIGATLDINTRVNIFPSFIIPILENQNFVGGSNYMPNIMTIFVWIIFSSLFIKKSKQYYQRLFFSFLLIFAETAANLELHKIHTPLYSPLILVLFELSLKALRLKSINVNRIFIPALLWVTNPIWIPPLENMIYNKLLLFFIPHSFFGLVPYLLIILFLFFLIKNILNKNINIKIVLIPLTLFFVLNLFYSTNKSEFGDAKWIWYDSQQEDQYLTFKKQFFIKKDFVKNSKVIITANSAYKLYINKNFVGLGPGPIDVNEHYYDEYNLTPYLSNGLNEIEIISFNYGYARHFQDSLNGGLIAKLSFSYGPLTLLLDTNDTWLVTNDNGWLNTDDIKEKYEGFEIKAGRYFEIYDFALINKKYLRAKENNVQEVKNLTKRNIPKLMLNTIEPKSTIVNNQNIIVEFNQVLAGYPNFTFKTSGKTEVSAKYYEDEYSNVIQEDKFILPSAGEYKHQVFGRRGFKLVELSWNSPVTLDVIVNTTTVRFPAVKTGNFISSDKLLNEIYNIGAKTLEYGLQDQFEDSYVYERSQYLGDAYVNMLMGFYSLDAQILAKKALFQYASTQKESGLIRTVYPSGLDETILSYNLLFTSFLKDYYLYTGDEETLRTLLPVADEIIHAFSMILDENGVVKPHKESDETMQYGEVLTTWINHASDPKEYANVSIVLSSLYYNSLDDLETMHSYLDVKKSNFYKDKKNLYKEKFNKLLTLEYRINLEPHSLVMLIWSDVLEPDSARVEFNHLINNDPVFVTGYFNLFYLQVLQKFNATDEINLLLKNYWGEMIRRGADSTWEVFDPRIAGVPNTSLTHSWSGTPTYFLPAYVSGVRPLEPNFTSIIIEPTILTRNSSSSLIFNCGEINTNWELRTNLFTLNFSSQCHGKALFKLPFNGKQIKEFFVNGEIIDVNINDGFIYFETYKKEIEIKIIL